MQKHKCKRLLSLLLTAAMLLSILTVTAFAADSDFAGGSGTAGDPYLISTADQLKAMSGKEAAYYLLINDLTLDAASGIALFTGTFDGGGHTISGIKSSLFTKVGAGDFVIKNITLDFNSTNYRGAVFGDISGTASVTMSNVHAIHRGTVKESGLVGEYGNLATIENCSVIFESGANCTGTEYVGGLARRISDKYTIKDSFVYIKDGATLKVTAPPNDKRIICGVGGLAGTVAKPNISNTYVINQGKIASDVTVGSGGKPSTFTAGSGVYGGSWAGGNIKNSYAYQAGEVTYIDNTSATDRVGILAGNGQSAVSLENFVYFTDNDSIALNGDDTNANKANAGGMKAEDTFTVWNLNTAGSSWVQDSNKSPAYNSISGLEGVPYLKMEETAELVTKFTEVNKNGDDDVMTALESAYSSYTLTGVANGEAALNEGADYTFADGKLTVKNSYIKTLSKDTTATLTLTFDKGLPVNFYIHVVEKPVVRLGTAANGSAVFSDGTTKARDAVAGAEVTVIAAPATGYVLKGWKVGDDEQPDSAKDEWTYTLPSTITDDITITPVFEASTEYVVFTLKDELDNSADMTGAVVTITKDSSTVATWTWNRGATYHKALAKGDYQYTVTKGGYITKSDAFKVDYSSAAPASVELTIGKYYVGPYKTEQKLTASGSGSGIYTVSYTLNKIRAVSGQLTVTLPTGVTLMNGESEAAEGDVKAAVTAGTGITVDSASLSSNTLTIIWAVDSGVTPHYVDTLSAAETILSFKVQPTYGSAATVTASGSVADNKPDSEPGTYSKDLSVSVGVNLPKYAINVTNGTASLAGEQFAGTTITITANAAETGKQFKEWTGVDGLTFVEDTSKNSSTAKFTMPDRAVNVTATYEGAPLTGTAKITGTAKYGQTLTASLEGGNNTGTLSYQWKRGSTNIGTNSETYVLTADDIGSTITVTISSSVQTGTQTSAGVTVVSLGEISFTVTGGTFTYDGATHGVTVSGADGCTLTYSIEENGSYSSEMPTVKNVGQKTVYVKASKTGYTDTVKSATIEVTAREVSITWPETVSFTYDGTEKSVIPTIGNLVVSESVTLTVTNDKKTEVGNYTAEVTGLDGTNKANYKLPTSGTTKAWSIASAGEISFDVTGGTFTYDGETHGVTVSGAEDCTLTYSTEENGSYSSEMPTVKNVGQKTVYVKASKTGYTDTVKSATIEVTAREVSITWPETVSFTYDGTEKSVIPTIGNLVVSESVTLTVTNDKKTEVGNYTAEVTGLDGVDKANYKLPASGKTQNWSIAARTLTVTSIEVNSTGHKTTYTVGETLDVTGLTILATKSDSSTETVNVTAGMVTGFDSSAATASQTLTITYQGKTTTYTIHIVAPSVYSIAPDTTGTYIFTAATVGYETQAAKTVTVTNNGTAATGALTVALSGTNADSFTLSKDSMDSIAVSGSDTFTVAPNTGLAAGTYTATVAISGEHDIAASFHVSFTVNEALTYSIAPDTTGTYTFTAATVGYGAQTAKTVTVSNTGTGATGALTVALSGTNADSFTLSKDSMDSIAVSGSDTFTVAPKTGLTAGTYTATVTISGEHGITASFDVSFTVNAAPVIPDDSGSGGSSNTSTTTKNPDGSTTTTVTDKKTGTVTETTEYPDGSSTTVETKKDGTVTETAKTTDGTTGTVVTDKNGDVTEVKSTVSTKAVTEAAKTGEAVTLPVEVPAAKTAEDASAVQVTMPKSAGSVKVEIPVEKVTPGTVAVIVKADGTEEIVKTSVVTENGVTLKLDGSVTVKVIDNSKEFMDVHPVNHWAEGAIDFVTAREMFNGTSTTTFTPDVSMTRAQMMTVLARFDGVDTTSGSMWYEKGMEWAKANGVSDGTNPNGSITREQLATMLWRYSGSPVVEGGLDRFSDADKVSGYAVDAMRWAVEIGLIDGIGNDTLAPQGDATRAQLAAILMRYCENLAE